MDDDRPLVSIVTPVFNGSKYLEELLQSVREQEYPRIEHIVIDDGSTDDGATVDILKRYPHVRWWSRPNRGAYATMNEGLAASTGDLLTVICADDKYASPTAIAAAVDLWKVHPACDVVYGDTITIGEDGRPLDCERPRGGPLWLFPYYPVTAHCSMLVRRSAILDKTLWFDESLPYSADWDWIMKMIRDGLRFRRLRRPIAMFRQHPLQRSTQDSPGRKDERRRLEERYGRGSPVVGFCVRKWVQLTMIRNLLARRGVLGACREIKRLKSANRTK